MKKVKFTDVCMAGWQELSPTAAIQTSVNLTFFKKEYLLQFSTFSSHILLFLLIVPVSFNFHVFIAKLTIKFLIIYDNA